MGHYDYERIILTMSIVSLFPIWAMFRLWGIVLKDQDGSLRAFTMKMVMMYSTAVVSAFLILPLFSFLVFGKVFP